MRVYSALEEENIRDSNLVREWIASGLLDHSQSTFLRTELQTDLRQTNVFLRGVLWIFTTLIVVTGVGLLATFDFKMSHSEGAILFIVSGLVCWVLSEFACRNRLYRYGVEESLAVCAAVLFAIGSSETFHEAGEWGTIAGLAVGSLAGLAIYLRFGFIYAAVGSLAACAAIPFQLDIGNAGKRLASALVFATALALVRLQRQESEEPAGSGLAAIEAAAWLGTYLMLNIQLAATLFAVPTWLFYSPYRAPTPEIATWFFIFSWAMIWLLPAAGLWLGLAKKDRLLVDVSIAMTLLTLSTNKRYLGWEVHAWDPMLLGLVLMTAAIVIRRWLQSGLSGERDGFTALRLLRSDERKLAAISIASSVMQPHTSSTKHSDAPHDFREGGGSSGGGGASGTF
jgi:uncharacterized membrane protein YgcG